MRWSAFRKMKILITIALTVVFSYLLTLLFFHKKDPSLDLYLPQQGGAELVVFVREDISFGENVRSGLLRLQLEAMDIEVENFDIIITREDFSKKRVIVRSGILVQQDEMQRGYHHVAKPEPKMIEDSKPQP